MPRTRTDRSRDDKTAEIVELAAARLEEGGLGALSVAAIARELGLAHSAIYWYFPTKDHLVVAAFERLVQKLIQRKPRDTTDVTKKVMWFVDQLGELYPVRAAMRAEAQHSDVIAEYLGQLDRRLRTMTRHVLEPHVDAADLEMATASFVATVQGSFLEGMKPAERRRLLTFALRRLVS
jgi:AcrR family transcriptional regulator